MTDTCDMATRRGRPSSEPGAPPSWIQRRRRDDRGATLVEAAFVMPVFVLMIFGIFEFSGNIMARNGAEAAVKAGARMATVQGNDPMADRAILNRMNSEGAGVKQDNIQQVIIWRVNNPANSADLAKTPPAACTSASVGFRVVVSLTDHPCNVYNNPQNAVSGAFTEAKRPLTTDFTPTATLSATYADYWFGCDTTNDSANAGHKLDCGWEPHLRRDLEESPTHVGACTNRQCDATDVVGIYIKVLHTNYTGFFGSNVTITTSTFAPIEPQGYDQ